MCHQFAKKWNDIVHGDYVTYQEHMMTPSKGTIFCVTGPLCGEFTGHRCSVAQSSRSQDIDLFKFQLSYCYNPFQDTCPITSAVLGHLVRTRVPFIFLHWDKKSYRLSEKCATLPVNSPHKGLWPGALMLSLICAWTNGWVNNRDVGDLRRHHAHYDVTVLISYVSRGMFFICIVLYFIYRVIIHTFSSTPYLHLKPILTNVLIRRWMLTQWGRYKMVAIFRTTYSNAFSWMKMYEFRLRFHWSLFLRVQLTISQHWFR